jgi:lathosterol oxidase
MVFHLFVDLRDPLEGMPVASPQLALRGNVAVVVCLVGSGMLSSEPTVWYACFVRAVFYLLVGSLSTAAIFQMVARRYGKLIQASESAQPERIWDEIKHTVIGFGLVVGALIAWPMSRAAEGHETALRADLADCGVTLFVGQPHALSVALYLVKALVGLLVADAYNYWKHRLFHSKALWAFHKTHHSHHNPSAIGGFAVEPMFSFVTFWPILLFCFPQLGLYLPLHWPILLVPSSSSQEHTRTHVHPCIVLLILAGELHDTEACG